eukprot:4372583-Alexandrium_andersonii.AAC.1
MGKLLLRPAPCTPYAACAFAMDPGVHEHFALAHACTPCSMHRYTCTACRSGQAHLWLMA